MAVSITKLRGLILTYSGYDLSEIPKSELDDLKNNIEEMSHAIVWELNEDFILAGDEAGKSEYISSSVSQLTYLSDGINDCGQATEKFFIVSGLHEWVLLKITKLLEHIFNYFPDFFNLDASLPIHFLKTYKALDPASNNELRKKLSTQKVDPFLAEIIINFSQAGYQSDKFKIKTWRQWCYQLQIIKDVSELLDTYSGEDANLELLKLFISREFNSIQVYGYFVKYLEKTTLGESSYPEQQQDLLFMLKTFRQVRTETQYYYDSKVQSLKTSVLESLQAELSYIEQKEKIYLQSFKASNPDKPSKFYFKVAVTLAELMFLFRVMLEVAFISTKFNSYLYEFISNHIQTERAENISKKSMRNHFNNKPFPDRVVMNVRSWLDKLSNHIDLYYKY